MTFNWTLPYFAPVQSLAARRNSAGPAGATPPAAGSAPPPAAAPTPTPTPSPDPTAAATMSTRTPIAPERFTTPHADGNLRNPDGSYRVKTIELAVEELPQPDGSNHSVTTIGVTIDVRADDRDSALANRAAQTEIIAAYVNAKWTPDAHGSGGTVAAPTLALAIQTHYGPGSEPELISAYGRGTTDEDRAAGKTTLGDHERAHGIAFQQYLEAHPLPTFELKQHPTVEEYRAARDSHMRATNDYVAQMRATVEREGDCVGTRADFCDATSQPTPAAAPAPSVAPLSTTLSTPAAGPQ